MEALLAVDELGLHGGVEVVLGDPVGDALGEGEVVEGVAEFGDRILAGAFDLDDLVDGAGVPAAFRANCPVEGSTIESALAKATASEVGLVERFAPMWVPPAKKGLRASTPATVVSSLMTTWVLAVRVPQVSRTAKRYASVRGACGEAGITASDDEVDEAAGSRPAVLASDGEVAD